MLREKSIRDELKLDRLVILIDRPNFPAHLTIPSGLIKLYFILIDELGKSCALNARINWIQKRSCMN